MIALPTASSLTRAAGRMTQAAALAAAVAAAGALAAPSHAQAGRVEIVTNTPGASCVIRQNGQNTRTVQSTPARVKILTRAEGLRVTCRLAGVGSATYELGKPDSRRLSINGDDFESRSAQRRRFARLRRLQRIELDLITNQARTVSRPAWPF